MKRANTFKKMKPGMVFASSIFLVLVFILMFISIPETAKSFEEIAWRLGIDTGLDADIPFVADAWTPPNNGNSWNFLDSHQPAGYGSKAPINISTPDSVTMPDSFNKARYHNSLKNINEDIKFSEADSTGSSAAMHTLFYRDYILDDHMKAGIKNGLINSITYKMQLSWTLKFEDDGGPINQHCFIAVGTVNGQPALNNFSSAFSDYSVVSKQVRKSSNDALQAEMTVTLTVTEAWKTTLGSSTANIVMRVGMFLHILPNRSFWGAGVSWPAVRFENPTAKGLTISWTKPSLLVKKDGVNGFGTVSGPTAYTGGSAAVVSSFNNAPCTFTVTPYGPSGINGYYFSGWTGSALPSYPIGYSNRDLTFSIRGACDLPRGTNTYTANFRSYTLGGIENEYVYRQSSTGVGNPQGPTTPSGNLTNDIGATDIRAYPTYTGGGYNSSNQPVNKGVYSLSVVVKDGGGKLFSGEVVHTYNFSINSLNITGKQLNLVGEYTYNGTDLSYSSPGVRRAPNDFTFSHTHLDGTTVLYKMFKGTDYSIDEESYVNDWKNSTNSQEVINDPTKGPGIQLRLTGTGILDNFTGAITAYAKINPINITSSSVTLGYNLGDEIRARYNTTYTGFAIEPDVFLVRITSGGKEFTLIAHDSTSIYPDRRQLYIDNYSNFGSVEGYSAYREYGGSGGGMDWVSGFFSLNLGSYYNNTNPTTTAEFTIKIVDNGYQNFVGPGGVTDFNNATKKITFDIPKRDVNDTYDDDTNPITIISDYSSITSDKPYIAPIVYNGGLKKPHIYYVLIKVTGVKLYIQGHQGDFYWTNNGTAFFALTNASNGIGDASPPTAFTDLEDYVVINAGTFNSSVSYTSGPINNIDVASGGVVNITVSDSAYLSGDFQLTFPITQKELSNDPDSMSGGGYINDISDQTYDFGRAITPTITAKATSDYSEEGEANEHIVTLISGKDFTLSYTDNSDITRDATVTLTGIGNYKGVISKTFNICARDITYEQNVTIENIASVTYTGSKFTSTSSQLTVDAGEGNGTFIIFSNEYSVTGTGDNLNAGPGSFEVTFGGYTAGETGVPVGTGPRFAGKKTVDFTILPKNINSGNITKQATWVLYDPTLVTYDGTQKAPLPIVTTGSTRTVVIQDIDREAILVYSTSTSSGDYMLAPENTWGENIVAGIESGSVRLKGINNYSGEVVVYFQILAKSIEGNLNVILDTGAGSGYNSTLLGYDFTGSKIQPNVLKVEISQGSAGMLELVNNTDYEISYGSPSDPQVNVFARKQGIITVTGKGNYQGAEVKSFTVLPIEQTVIFLDPLASDPDIKVESITKLSGHSYYADYEINADTSNGRKIILKAKTTAIYPTARLIKFTAFVSGGVAVSNISYVSCIIEEENGIQYSVTTAEITVASENRYGRIRIEAEQFDNEINTPPVTIGANEFFNEGNYRACEYSPTNPNNDVTYWFFMKKQDTFEIDSINKTYGNDEFLLYRNKLASYITNNPGIYSSISVLSTNEDVVVASKTGDNWNIVIKKVGDCYLTFSHSGYVVNESTAYLAFSKDIPVTIHKRNLEISFESTETTYGTRATFTYTFRTWATDPAKGTDEKTKLIYQSFTDEQEDIMTGLIINYFPDGEHKESTKYFEDGQEKNNPYSITVTTGMLQYKGVNYNITTKAGDLTVLKKVLNASTTNTGDPNVVRKEYGADNPIVDNITYTGWIDGENLMDLLMQGVPFTPPTLKWITLQGNPILAETKVGTYNITLSGGMTKNYSIPTVNVDCVIVAVSPIIELSPIHISYQAASIGYENDDVEILPVGENCTVPKAGTLSFQYRYGEQPWTNDKPRRAGTYSTRVIYKAEINDNYKDTTKDFVNNVIIAKAEPTINLSLPEGEEYYVRNFTGLAIDVASIQPTVLGVGSDRPAGGTIFIQFRVTGEAQWEDIAIDVGKYDLRISFVASENDNYTNYTEIFIYALQIDNEVVDIVLQAGCRMLTDFDGLGHFFDITKVKFLGSPTDLDEFNNRKEILGDSEVKYSLDGGATWTDNAPMNAGIYTVSIKHTPESGSNYKGNTMTFNKYNGQDLFVIYKRDVKDFMGLDLDTALRWTYDTDYHTVSNDRIVLGRLENDTEGPSGSVSMGYRSSGNPSAPIIVRVRDVGTYDVVLQYIEGDNDNYEARTPQVIQGKLIIEPAPVTIIFASEKYNFDFTGDSQRVSAVMRGVKEEIPKGTLLYQYKLNGSGSENFSTTPPVNAGVYDMRVTYQQRIDVLDNYAATSMTRDSIIIIRKIAPIIIINDMILENGVIDENYVPDVTLRGASRDTVGPSVEDLSFEFAIFADGSYSWYTWSSTSYPLNSGKYSLRVIYNPTESQNYTATNSVKYMCIEIKNISPKFRLNLTHAYYTGKAVPAPSVQITNIPAGVTPLGSISYEYKKQGTTVWRNSPPQDVGIYDIRVKYTENPKGDSFSSFSQVEIAALTIEALPITIVPLIGQGNIYGSKSVASEEIIFSYLYQLNGFEYYVYPEVIDRQYGDYIDVATSEYIAGDGYVYSIDMVGGAAYREYAWDTLSILEANFSYEASNGNRINEVIGQNVDVFEGAGTFVEFFADSGREYILDAEKNIVKHKNQYDNVSYKYEVKGGHYFSIENVNGSIENIEIDRSKVAFLDQNETIGDFSLVRSGTQIKYRVNYNTMKVSQGIREYPIKLYSGSISYSVDGSVTKKTILIDEERVFARNLQTDSGHYLATDGYVYEIFFGEDRAVRWFPLTFQKLAFSFTFEDLITLETKETNFELEVSNLTPMYSYDTGIYSYDDLETGQKFVINLYQKIVKKDLKYSIANDSAGNYFKYKLIDGTENRVYLNSANYVVTNIEGVYIYTDNIYNHSYCVDTNKGYARKVENRLSYSLADSQLVYEKDGDILTIEVDYHDLYFNTYTGSINKVLSRRIQIFGKEFDFSPPALVAPNNWLGSLKAQLGGAGSYVIGKGDIGAGSNYVVSISTASIKYSVDKAPLYITFTGPENNVYNGTAKQITYEVFGLIGTDSKEIIGLIEMLEGDNVSASSTNTGFYLAISIDPINSIGANYYLINSTSNRYSIAPAQMEQITFTPLEGGLVFDGTRHELKLTGIDPSYTILYDGNKTIPTFRDPGTYHVKALVQKENYYSQEVDLSLTIKKGLFEIEPNPLTGVYFYGDSMPALSVASEQGYIKFMSGQKLHPSISEYYWEFIPYDENFYDYFQGLPENGYLIKGKMNLVVMKATPTIQISGQLVQTETTPTAILPLINGQVSPTQEVSVLFKAGDGTVYTSLPSQPGKYTVVVEYKGDELYEETVFETTLTIEAKNNMQWLWVVGGIIIGLTLLSALFFLIRKPKSYT